MCKGQRFLASKLRFIVMFVETPEKSRCFVLFNNDNYLCASSLNFVVIQMSLLWVFFIGLVVVVMLALG
jgi:hypothetical protein